MEITPDMVYAQKKINENIQKDFDRNLKDETVEFMKTRCIIIDCTKEEANEMKKLDEKIHEAEIKYKSKFPGYDMNNKSDRQAFRGVYVAFNAEELIREGLLSKSSLYNSQMERKEIEEAMKQLKI